jgi:hypothetical protein
LVGVLGEPFAAVLGSGFTRLFAGALARWLGEFFQRLLPESFGPEFGGGLSEAFPKQLSDVLESLFRQVLTIAEPTLQASSLSAAEGPCPTPDRRSLTGVRLGLQWPSDAE